MSSMLIEGNLQFDFSAFKSVERFDDGRNPYGLKSVDFIIENTDAMIFIEVKDYQNPKATAERRVDDLKKLAIDSNRMSAFCTEMGEKIKDSILRKYALGAKFNKDLVFLLLINMDALGKIERGRLKEKISGHVPTGLNDDTYNNFSHISFDLVDIEQLKKHGVRCKARS